MTQTTLSATTLPPYDVEIVGALRALAEVTPHLSDETLPAFRHAIDAAPVPDLAVGGRVVVTERTAGDVPLTVLSPADAQPGLPVIFYVHGGALVLGNRFQYLDTLAPYAAEGRAVVVAVGYRFAPEHPAPAQLEDCYAGLVWTADHADELGIDADRITVVGISAGGGLALGVSLLARDRQGPRVSHQVLVAPMLDDRMQTASSTAVRGVPSDAADIEYGWRAALGDGMGGPDVSPYVAPARATDLTGLPRTYLDVGGSEGFRDEVLDLASRLSHAGVQVDLHLWGGGYHGFDLVAPDAAVSRAARAARDEFIRRALGA